MKRTFDIVASAFGLLLLSPVLAAAALLIKLTSRGPVLFRQERREALPTLLHVQIPHPDAPRLDGLLAEEAQW